MQNIQPGRNRECNYAIEQSPRAGDRQQHFNGRRESMLHATLTELTFFCCACCIAVTRRILLLAEHRYQYSGCLQYHTRILSV